MVWAGRAGRCPACKEMVEPGDMAAHPCRPATGYDTSWNAEVNPDNEQWRPGYRFCVMQKSGARTRTFRAKLGRMTPRTYRVYFEITAEGGLRHTGGPRPTDELIEGLQALYERERPGSNWYPGAEEGGI